MRAQATEQLTILPDSKWRYDLSNLSQIMVYETAFYDITLLPILRRCVEKQTLFEKYPAAEKVVRTQINARRKSKLKISRIETSIFHCYDTCSYV